MKFDPSPADRGLPVSHPSRVCGLKYSVLRTDIQFLTVTPFTGVWIEMRYPVISSHCRMTVTPFTGVWIEIPSPARFTA